jgi:hypothetical protein
LEVSKLVLQSMDEPGGVHDVSRENKERASSRAGGRASASLESGREHLKEMTACYLRGTHALHDLEEAVIDFAMIGRTTGVPPEELLVAMKEMCEPVWESPYYSPDETAEIRDRFVKRLIDTYFADPPNAGA